MYSMELVKKCLTVIKNNKFKTLLIVFIINVISLMPHYRVQAKKKKQENCNCWRRTIRYIDCVFLRKTRLQEYNFVWRPRKKPNNND